MARFMSLAAGLALLLGLHADPAQACWWCRSGASYTTSSYYYPAYSSYVVPTSYVVPAAYCAPCGPPCAVAQAQGCCTTPQTVYQTSYQTRTQLVPQTTYVRRSYWGPLGLTYRTYLVPTTYYVQRQYYVPVTTYTQQCSVAPVAGCDPCLVNTCCAVSENSNGGEVRSRSYPPTNGQPDKGVEEAAPAPQPEPEPGNQDSAAQSPATQNPQRAPIGHGLIATRVKLTRWKPLAE